MSTPLPTGLTPLQEQLFATLVAVQGDVLLLPNVAIVEVVSAEGVKADADAPDWFAGRLAWQGRDLPVCRFERLNGQLAEAPGRRTRVAVINALGSRLPGQHFGLLCEGHPQLVTLNRQVVRPLPLRATDVPAAVLTRALLASQETAIPDLEYIEARLSEL